MDKIEAFLLSNRMKSLYWRTGVMFITALCNLLMTDYINWGLNGTWTVMLGLVLGEVTKALNNYSQGKAL